MASEPTTRRFTVEEYYRMVEAGILGEDDRVELLDGEIVQMSPIGSQHAGTVARLQRRLERAVGDHAIVWVQNPIRLSAMSEPQPDLCLLRPRADDYTRSHPGPEDVLLLIEVADASLRYDRDVKIPAYARAGIPEVWFFDLPGRRIYAYRDPLADGYRTVIELKPGNEFSLTTLPAVRVTADEVLL